MTKSKIHERAYRNQALTELQRASNMYLGLNHNALVEDFCDVLESKERV